MKQLDQPNCLSLDFFIRDKDILTFLAASAREPGPDKYRKVLSIHLKGKYFLFAGKYISKPGNI